MSSITMRSGITRARATFCCSLARRIFIARGRFSAAKDWVGSCGTIIKRRHKPGDVPPDEFFDHTTYGARSVYVTGEAVAAEMLRIVALTTRFNPLLSASFPDSWPALHHASYRHSQQRVVANDVH